MKFLKLLFFPLSLIYGAIGTIRNTLYAFGFLKSSKFDLPIISIGNLSMGGTGKTPHTEYLINLLKNNTNVATLSRGYLRKTTGFYLADENSSFVDIGDEPFQLYQKHKSTINVAVDAKRVRGVVSLLTSKPNTDLILLDDAFQHRPIEPSLNILLTDYKKPFYNDFVIPAGSLREFRAGYKRADIIIVTKCPKELGVAQRKEITNRIKPKSHQKIFFSSITYQQLEPVFINAMKLSLTKDHQVLLLSGIANVSPLRNHIEASGCELTLFNFADHHRFTSKEIDRIVKTCSDEKTIIITTEKDAVRLRHDFKNHPLSKMPVYYIPIKISFFDDTAFNEVIKNHIAEFS